MAVLAALLLVNGPASVARWISPCKPTQFGEGGRRFYFIDHNEEHSKQLLALSALSLAAAGAHAQSFVTLFGVVDATFAHGSGSVADRTQFTRGALSTPGSAFWAWKIWETA